MDEQKRKALENVFGNIEKQYGSGAVWLRYNVEK